MARPKPPPWRPPYERFVVHFFNKDWEEIPHLRDGPVSAVGVVNIMARYFKERELMKTDQDVILSPYLDAEYVGVSPYEEEKIIHSATRPKLSQGSNRSASNGSARKGGPPDAV